MVVAVFPLAKIGLLLIKQISKPLSNIVKNEAKKRHTIRKYIIIPIGKAYQWVEFSTSRGQKKEMPEDEIVELGANAIGEIVLFGILSATVLYEVNRQGDKKAVVQKTKDDELFNIVDTLTDLIGEVDTMKRNIENIKKDLSIAHDVIALEEEKHPIIHDYNFIDVMIGNSKVTHSRRKRNKMDSISPSI